MNRDFRPTMRIIFPLTILGLLSVVLLAADGAAVKIVHKSSFSVVGVEVRTSNAKETTSDGIIGKQWQKFFEDDTLEKIPNKSGSNLYAVYSDYSGDHNGEYSFLIGARVEDGSTAPPGFVLKTIPSGKYAVVTTERGPVAKVVVAAWKQVWQMEEKHELGGSRTYKADFEVYDQRATDPENSEVDLYIGVK
jgi:predicted transcriptional regulator YdeE